MNLMQRKTRLQPTRKHTLLHIGLSVGEARGLSSLATKETAEVGPDLVGTTLEWNETPLSKIGM